MISKTISSISHPALITPIISVIQLWALQLITPYQSARCQQHPFQSSLYLCKKCGSNYHLNPVTPLLKVFSGSPWTSEYSSNSLTWPSFPVHLTRPYFNAGPSLVHAHIHAHTLHSSQQIPKFLKLVNILSLIPEPIYPFCHLTYLLFLVIFCLLRSQNWSTPEAFLSIQSRLEISSIWCHRALTFHWGLKRRSPLCGKYLRISTF